MLLLELGSLPVGPTVTAIGGFVAAIVTAVAATRAHRLSAETERIRLDREHTANILKGYESFVRTLQEGLEVQRDLTVQKDARIDQLSKDLHAAIARLTTAERALVDAEHQLQQERSRADWFEQRVVELELHDDGP